MIRPIRFVALCLLLTILAIPGFAYRREYVVTVDGHRKAGSEVCFYKGAPGDAFSLYFTPGNVQCLSADAILDFPPGLIHAFARHKEGYASVSRDYTVYSGPPKPEKGYEKLEIPLAKAGIVDFAAALKNAGPDQRVGLWIASTPASVGTFVPLVPGETTILAPVAIPVTPLLVENGLPVAVGEPLYLDAGERQAAIFKKHPDSSDVILWTHLDLESSRQTQAVLQPPAIVLKAGDHTFRPVAPIYSAESNALLIFRGVPFGKAIITAEGSMWQRVTREMTVARQTVTNEREAVPLVAGGSINVRWSAEGAPKNVPQCPAARTSDVPLVRASVLHCVDGSDEAKKCSTIAKMTAPYDSSSSLSFDGIPAGSHSVVIEPPYGKRQTLAADVVAGRNTTLDVTFPSFKFFGTLKVNGEPSHARLIFSSGQAVSDHEGRYDAILPVDPRTNQIQIEPCEEKRTFRYIPKAGPAPNAAFDLDVRLLGLQVNVTDPQHRPLADAAVRFSPIKEIRRTGTAIYFGSREKQTDTDGRVSFDDVPEGFLVSVCARHEDFAQKCSAPVDLSKLGGNPVAVEFDPVATRGRVEGHTGWGYIATVNSAGVITEHVDLDDGGTFIFRLPHASPEHLIYASQTRPLTVVPLPLAVPPELDIQVPAVPIRTFTVSVPNLSRDHGYLGIWVGGMFVPLQVFNVHMEMRGLDSELHRGASLRVPDIAETGPIAVAVAVLPDETAKEWVDPFTLPEYAGIQRHRVEGTTIVLSQ